VFLQHVKPLVDGYRWKEERRRHYPTASNLAKREAEAKSREEAGGM